MSLRWTACTLSLLVLANAGCGGDTKHRKVAGSTAAPVTSSTTGPVTSNPPPPPVTGTLDVAQVPLLPATAKIGPDVVVRRESEETDAIETPATQGKGADLLVRIMSLLSMPLTVFGL